MQHINVGKIIVQEIVNYFVKKDGMLYFQCLIIAMCKNNLVHVMEGYEIQKPINGFDAKSIDTLLKGNTGRKPRLQLLASATNIAATGMPEAMEKLSAMHKDMQAY
jgi:hypothetical protein